MRKLVKTIYFTRLRMAVFDSLVYYGSNPIFQKRSGLAVKYRTLNSRILYSSEQLCTKILDSSKVFLPLFQKQYFTKLLVTKVAM